MGFWRGWRRSFEGSGHWVRLLGLVGAGLKAGLRVLRWGGACGHAPYGMVLGWCVTTPPMGWSLAAGLGMTAEGL
jgi:hypothetical protein